MSVDFRIAIRLFVTLFTDESVDWLENIDIFKYDISTIFFLSSFKTDCLKKPN